MSDVKDDGVLHKKSRKKNIWSEITKHVLHSYRMSFAEKSLNCFYRIKYGNKSGKKSSMKPPVAFWIYILDYICSLVSHFTWSHL